MFLLVVLAACSGSGDDSAGADTAVDLSTFSALQTNVLNLSCAFSSCHGAASGGLDLTEGVAYAALVGVHANEAPEQVLVVPGDPDNSYFIWKMEGTEGIIGDEMPPGGSVGQEKLDAFRAWIAAGAPDN